MIILFGYEHATKRMQDQFQFGQILQPDYANNL